MHIEKPSNISELCPHAKSLAVLKMHIRLSKALFFMLWGVKCPLTYNVLKWNFPPSPLERGCSLLHWNNHIRRMLLPARPEQECRFLRIKPLHEAMQIAILIQINLCLNSAATSVFFLPAAADCTLTNSRNTCDLSPC